MTNDQCPRTAAEIVAARWAYLLEEGESADLVRLDVVRAAHSHPRLRALFPCVSHGALYFSAFADPPHRRIGGQVYHPVNGRFVVTSFPEQGTLGEADTLEEAFAIVAEHLPPDTGPAVLRSPAAG
ncbi:DUF6193 family natural product biosynthesis protein [Streptomyces tsukubensis]|uniref:DUF6193 family natural product biosynthesis protein n=1 Tax=Streptomyces tsukubensis TaxID=83656 RepID=UPI0036BEB26C